MHGYLKHAAESAFASSTGATAASPLPSPSIDPTPAPGKRGPVGLSPRTNYSRVNTGAPPQVDAGATVQKSMPPRGAEMLPKHASVEGGEGSMGKLAGRPMLQDLVKAAMVESADRVRVTEEARVQARSGEVKTASDKTAAPADGERVEKLAAAVDFCAELLRKEGTTLGGQYHLTEHLQTSAPGVSHATASEALPDHKGQGAHVVPMHTGSEKVLKAEHGATQNETNMNHPAELHAKNIERNYGGKHANVVSFIRSKLGDAKTAADEHEKKETAGLEEAKKGLDKAEEAHRSEPENKEGQLTAVAEHMRQRVKQAEDAINPAQISAGPAVPPAATAGGQPPGQQPAGGAPKGPTGLVGSADSARHYTKGQAYASRKEDLGKYFKEPALSAEHDKVLQVAFNHTGQAGPKIASAEVPVASTQAAAARVLLSKIAAEVEKDAAAAANTGT